MNDDMEAGMAQNTPTSTADVASDGVQTAPQPSGVQEPGAAQPAPGGEAAAGTPGAESGGDRVAELETALAAAKAEAAQHWDKYLRERAEMENYKRRIERTYADLAKRGRKDLYVKLLNALDNLERAVSYQSSSGQQVDVQSLLTGLRLTYQQFLDLLAAEGIKEVKALGEQFDPALHEAVATEVTAEVPDGQIVTELQKGYTYQDELLRPARVRVATKG
jgi:molecular chaperone GrpE